MEINNFLSRSNINVIECLYKIDECGYGILYIVDNERKLIGCISDGDIRRWIIKTNDLKAMVSEFMNSKPVHIYAQDADKIKDIRKEMTIRTVPVLDNKDRIVDILILNDDTDASADEDNETKFDAPVVVMAGGKGTRLYPYTKILPKPLIPIGEIPILERIFNRFNKCGLSEFYLTVNYKKNMIKSYFNDLKPPYNIVYVEETKPLGTGGSIKLINKEFDVPIIVANCDQLINTNYKDMYDYHIRSGNVVTIVSSLKNFQIPYGVLKTAKNGEMKTIEEKPTLSYFINTGMYVIDPKVISLIPDNEMYHMTDLIEDVKNKGWQVGIYPISEDSFLDMGEFSEMKRMENKLKNFGDY